MDYKAAVKGGWYGEANMAGRAPRYDSDGAGSLSDRSGERLIDLLYFDLQGMPSPVC